MYPHVPKIIALITFLVQLNFAAAQSAHNALRQGDKLYENGDYGKAQAAYAKAGNNIGLYNAGNAAMQQSNLSEAEALYAAVLSRSASPAQKSDALYNLGNACLLQKKYPEAIKAYENSLRISPNRPDAQKNLQIAKRLSQSPPPPTPPPPTPPPPKPKPQRYYVDQASGSRQPETPPANMPQDMARQILAKAVLSEEQKNARAYRELSPANRPSRLKKDW